MINIINEFNKNIIKSETYSEIRKKFHEIENHKLLAEDIDVETFNKSWGFYVHNKSTLKHLHDNLRTVPPLLKKAYEEELQLVEVCKGNPHNMTQIIVTDDVDLLKIEKGWCLDYCEAQGWRAEVL
jgi:hypothetical protein